MATVHSRHHRRIIFLLELDTQCTLAERVFRRLQKAAKAWNLHAEFEGETGAPIEILHLAHSFLTYSGVIVKIIFERSRKEKKLSDRCSDLQDLLEIKTSPHLEKLDVRNSLEHIDERLDEYIPKPPYKFESYAVGGVERREGKTVIRRFDPDKLEFWFLDKYVQLEPLFDEIGIIKSRIRLAFEKFTDK